MQPHRTPAEKSKPGNCVESGEFLVECVKRKPFKPPQALTYSVNEVGRFKALSLNHSALNSGFKVKKQ
jgi:hypothetical protein